LNKSKTPFISLLAVTTRTSSLNNDYPSGKPTSLLPQEHEQLSKSYPKSPKWVLHNPQKGYLATTKETSSLKPSLWTDDLKEAQVFYDQANAYYRAGLLSSIANCEVAVLHYG